MGTRSDAIASLLPASDNDNGSKMTRQSMQRVSAVYTLTKRSETVIVYIFDCYRDVDDGRICARIT